MEFETDSDVDDLWDDGPFVIEEPEVPRKRRRRPKVSADDLEQSPWGKMLRDPNISDPDSYVGMKFRVRFRTPYPVFAEIVVPMCVQRNVFRTIRDDKAIPVKFKVLISLRILGRGHDFDTMEELSMVPMSTCHAIFKQFIFTFVYEFFDEFVKMPVGDDLKKVMRVYKMMGLNGCAGSLDCTHIYWKRCPREWTNYCTGKEKTTTLAFLVVVDHDKRVLICSDAFFGAANDKLIVKSVPETSRIIHGSLQDVLYTLYVDDNTTVSVRGAWLLADGGFLTIGCFMDPGMNNFSMEMVRWSEFMESVRKDVECFFGIVKQRFRWLWGYNFSQDYETITAGFKTACILHNIILEYDRAFHEEAARWENVDWSQVDPNLSEEDIAAAVAAAASPENAANEDMPFLPDPISAEGAVAICSNSSYDYARLKDMLIRSFHIQFRMGQVYWPKRFQGWQRDCFALERIVQRITRECKNALYGRLSHYVNGAGDDIGEGLFSTIPFSEGDCIAEFHRDNDRSIDDAQLDLLKEVGLARFVIRIKDGVYWDCRLNRYAGICMASLANSPRGLRHRDTGSPAPRANCELRIHGSGSEKVARLVSLTHIDAHTEIMWNYGAGHHLN